MQSKPTTAAIYIRVSSAGQEDNYSLASQEQACRAHAAVNGYEVATVYREIHTGVELWERPQLSALREAIRRHEVDAVVVYAIDRHSRDPTHLGVIVSEAQHHDVTMLFVSEPLDTSPEGELIRFVRGYAAKIEHAKIVDRSMRGKIGRAQSGKPLAGRKAAFGYQWQCEIKNGKPVKSTYTVDPERAPIVRQLFEDAAVGRSLWQIVDDLNERGVPTPTGRPIWRVSSVYGMLRNPVYTGTIIAFRQHVVKDKRAGTSKVIYRTAGDPNVMVTKGGVPAIVSEDLYEAVRERFKANRATASRNHGDPRATLLRGGYVVCGHCGNVMYAIRRSGRDGYLYRCPAQQYNAARCTAHTIVARILDDEVWTRVSSVLRDPGLIEHKIAELRRNDPTAADVEAVERRIAATARQRESYLTNIGSAPTPEVASLMMGKVAALSEDLKALEAERDAVLNRRRAWEAVQTVMRDLQAWCERVAKRLERADYEMKRTALDYLGVRVKVYRPGSAQRFVIEAVTVTPDGEIISTITPETG